MPSETIQVTVEYKSIKIILFVLKVSPIKDNIKSSIHRLLGITDRRRIWWESWGKAGNCFCSCREESALLEELIREKLE